MAKIEEDGHGDFYDLTVPNTQCYFDDQGILHHNSGKDWLSARICAWVAYVLCNMVEPKRWLRPDIAIAVDERIDIVNVAPKGDLAKEVFFEYLKRCCKSKFMEPYVPDQKGQILTERIVFPQLNLRLNSLNSSTKGLDGYNPLVSIMDEADAFLDTEDKSNADKVYAILRTSATTRWSKFWLCLVLSYMRSGDGFMKRTLDQIKADLGKIAFHLRIEVFDQAASWEVNPNIYRDDPTIQAHYRNNPTEAAAMYEGIAPPVVGGFFENYELIAGSQGDHAPLVVWREQRPDEWVVRQMTDMEVPSMAAVIESVRREPGREYFIGLDGGEKTDAFVASIWSRESPEDLGPEVLCPRCRREWEVPGVDYRPLPESEARTARCPMCYLSVYDIIDVNTPPRIAVANWVTRAPRSEDGEQLVIVNGSRVSLPALREDGLIVVKPLKKDRSSYPQGVTVNFPAMEEVLAQIMLHLKPRYTRMDPWQTVQMRQSLYDRTSLDVGGISFSMPEQVHRATLVKILLYNNCLRMLGGTVAQKEWETLIRKNNRLDHPENGSKDAFDAQSIAIYLAMCASFNTFDLHFLTDVGPTRPA